MFVVSALRTTQPDPNGETLRLLSRIVAEQALCPACSQRRAWYYSQGRGEDWEAGRA